MRIKLKDLLDLVNDYEIVHLHWYDQESKDYFNWEGTICHVPIKFKNYIVKELQIEEVEAFCSKLCLYIDK